jgi:DNA-binding transcriptional LysR family regulator
VIYGPELTLSQPAGISACSGVNALAHAVEVLYTQDANPIVSLMAEESIHALAESLPGVVADPQDLEARSRNGEALVQAAVDGLGLVSLPRFLLEENLAVGRLIEVLADYPLPASQIYAVCPPGRRLPAKVRAFIDFLVVRFSS